MGDNNINMLYLKTKVTPICNETEYDDIYAVCTGSRLRCQHCSEFTHCDSRRCVSYAKAWGTFWCTSCNKKIHSDD